MPDSFPDRLSAAVRKCGNPVLVGLDPRFDRLPEPLRALRDLNAETRARAYADFCRGVIDVVAPSVPAVKPQAAFFEQLGPAGMTALGEVVRYASTRELIVVLDGKRNDIGTTAQAYADAWLGKDEQSAWGADALTVSPYLGDDSLVPFVEVAMQRAAGIFVLVKTSNPGSKTFQELLVDGRPVYRHVAQHVDDLARATVGPCGYGIVGAVVGATFPEQLAELRSAMAHTWFLVPGFGAQGGSAADVAGAFDDQGLGAIVNNSRGIIFAGDRPEYQHLGPARWQDAVEQATRDMIEQLRAETPAGKLG